MTSRLVAAFVCLTCHSSWAAEKLDTLVRADTFKNREVFEKACFRLKFHRHSTGHGEHQLAYFTAKGYPSSVTSSVIPGMQTQIALVDGIFFGSRFRTRMVTALRKNTHIRILENAYGVSNGEKTRTLSYPPAESLEQALEATPSPDVEVTKDGIIKVLHAPNDPIGILVRALGFLDDTQGLKGWFDNLRSKCESPEGNATCIRRPDGTVAVTYRRSEMEVELIFAGDRRQLPVRRTVREPLLRGVTEVEYFSEEESGTLPYYPKNITLTTYYEGPVGSRVTLLETCEVKEFEVIPNPDVEFFALENLPKF